MNWMLFSPEDTLPEAWPEAKGGNQFNNGIHQHGNDIVMTYRVVTPEGERRIAICRLNADYSVVAGSAVALSDHFSYADRTVYQTDHAKWVADARLFSVGTRLFAHYNSGSSPKPNKIFLVELDTQTLLPVGLVREVVAPTLARREVEKNWTFFADGEDVYTVYSFSPLIVLKVDLSDPNIVRCPPAFRHEWDAYAYSLSYGELRGGATPVRRDGKLYFVLHSIFLNEGIEMTKYSKSICYVAPVVTLEDKAPFLPIGVSARPLIEVSPRERGLNDDARLHARVSEDIYSCGAMAEADHLVVSYGLSNCYMVLRRIPFTQVDRDLIPALPRSPIKAAEVLPTFPSDDDRAKGNGAFSDEQLNAWWWAPPRVSPRQAPPQGPSSRRFVYGNFGDLLVPHLLGRVTGMLPTNVTKTSKGPYLYIIGSLLTRLGEGDVVWGTGVKGGVDVPNPPKEVHLFALRGPLSYTYMQKRGYDMSRVGALMDPGILTAHLFAKDIAALHGARQATRRPFLIVPHLNDHATMHAIYREHAASIRSVDTPFFDLVRDMLDSELVISSSLHGLIIAESLGVPAVWHAPIMGENELKFTDYYLGTDRWKIVRAQTLADALRASPMPLPKIDAPALLSSFPSADTLRDLGVLVSVPQADPGA